MTGHRSERGGPVFITGGSAGIGRALALHHAALGATVGVTGRRAAALASLAAEWPGRIVPLVADVRDAAAMRAAADTFIGQAGCPALVYGNAGISVGTLTDQPADAGVFREVMETNVLGLVHAFAPFIEPMRAAGGGTLAGIASVAGLRGLPGAGAYSASKAAAIAYLESLRIECRPAGIRVSTICPGYIATDMTARNPYPMPFLLSAEDAARRISRIALQGRSFAIVPWQMAIVGRVMKLLPDWLWDRALADAGRKPRRGDLPPG
jgi:NAD(P)-dependent dehydrogenase (short-subunit alcohol dehydrogenase family)